MDRNTIRLNEEIRLKSNVNACDVQKLFRPNLKEAIEFLDETWNSVTEQTIYNCWLKTKILRIELNGDCQEAVKIDEKTTMNDLNQLLNKLKSFNITNLTSDTDMTAEEYCEVDTNLHTFNVPSDHDIVDEVLIS